MKQASLLFCVEYDQPEIINHKSAIAVTGSVPTGLSLHVVRVLESSVSAPDPPTTRQSNFVVVTSVTTVHGNMH